MTSNFSYQSVPTTVEQARMVLWPFRELRGRAMGILLDNGELSLKDLGFAVQQAHEKRVREAARILLHTLTQADSPVAKTSSDGPLNVVSSGLRSFAERRQLQWSLLTGAFGGVMISLGLWLFLFSLLSPREDNPNRRSLSEILSEPEGWVALGLVIFILAMIFIGVIKILNWIMDRFDRQIRLYRKGQQGEERVLNVMYHQLDSNWWLFRNLELRGFRIGDIDMVLVGSQGIFCLEVKTFDGRYRTFGEQWEYYFRGRWIRTWSNPTRQAKRNAATLSHVLATHEIKQWVTPIVVWVNPEATLEVENPAAVIWHLDKIGIELNKLAENRSLLADQQHKIIEILNGFYQPQV